MKAEAMAHVVQFVRTAQASRFGRIEKLYLEIRSLL